MEVRKQEQSTGSDEEEHVVKELELVVKHFRYKGEDIVFSVFDYVCLIVYRLNVSVYANFSPRCLDIFQEVLLESLICRWLWLLKIFMLSVLKKLFL
jgi:hypothetical protein